MPSRTCLGRPLQAWRGTGPDRGEHGDVGDEGHGVQPEGRGQADRRDEQAAQRGARRHADQQHRAGQRRGAGGGIGGNQHRGERAAGGGVQGVDHAPRRRQPGDQGQPEPAGRRGGREARGDQGEAGLRDHQQPSPVVPVDDRAEPRPEQGARQELQRNHPSQRPRVECHDRGGQGDDLRPRTRHRGQLAGHVAAEGGAS
jgi:hypothetical protein